MAVLVCMFAILASSATLLLLGDVFALLLALGGLTLAMLHLLRPGLFVMLLLGCYILLGRQFAKTTLLSDPLPIYPGEVVLGLTALALLLRHLPRLDDTIRNLPYRKHVFLLFVLGAVSAVRGWPNGGTEAIRGYAVIYYVLPLWLVPFLLKSKRQLERAIHFLFLASCIVSVALLVAFDPLVLRESDIATPVVAFAAYICLALFLEIVRSLYRAPGWRFWMLLAPFQIFILIRMVARSSWIGIATALATMFLLTAKDRRLLRRSIQIAVTVSVIFVASTIGLVRAVPSLQEHAENKFTSIFFFKRMQGFEAENVRWRLDFWQDIIEQSGQAPVLGIGFGTPFLGPRMLARGLPSWYERAYYASSHNSYLDILLRAGFATLAVYLALIFRIIHNGVRSIRQLSDRRLQMHALWLLANFISIVVATNFSPILETPYVGILNWCMAGALVTVVGWSEKSADATWFEGLRVRKLRPNHGMLARTL